MSTSKRAIRMGPPSPPEHEYIIRANFTQETTADRLGHCKIHRASVRESAST
jgi:hypothetical protein